MHTNELAHHHVAIRRSAAATDRTICGAREREAIWGRQIIPEASARLFDALAARANKPPQLKEMKLAKAKKTPARKPYTAADIKLLKQHSRARTPVVKISKQMKRSVGSLRQKALDLGIGLGHQR
jgi:hypothetical protein